MDAPATPGGPAQELLPAGGGPTANPFDDQAAPAVAMQPMGEDAAHASASAPFPTPAPAPAAAAAAFPTPTQQAAGPAGILQTEAAKRAAQGMFQAGKAEAERFARSVPCRLLMVLPPALLMLVMLVPCSSTGCLWMNPRPRTISGLLWGMIIPLAPFVHWSYTYLWVDLTSWLALGWRLSGHGSGTFVSLCLVLLFVPALLTWCTGSVRGMYTGMAGVLFGIFGFNVSLLPVKHRNGTLTREDVVGFLIFDILFGGIWWCFSYQLPPFSWILAMWGLACGILFSVFSQGGERIEAERIPLLIRTERAVEQKTGPYVDRMCA